MATKSGPSATPVPLPWISSITSKCQSLFPEEDVEITFTKGSAFFSCHDCNFTVAVDDEQNASETAMEHLKVFTHVKMVCARAESAGGGDGQRSLNILKARLLASELEAQFNGTIPPPLEEPNQVYFLQPFSQTHSTHSQDNKTSSAQHENKNTLARLRPQRLPSGR